MHVLLHSLGEILFLGNVGSILTRKSNRRNLKYSPFADRKS